MFNYLLDTIILMYFVETGSKMKQKISNKIPKIAFARFRDAVSQTPQYAYFSIFISFGITSKASTMYAIADKNLS